MWSEPCGNQKTIEIIPGGGLRGIALSVMTVIFTGGAAYLVYAKFGWNPIVGLVRDQPPKMQLSHLQCLP